MRSEKRRRSLVGLFDDPWRKLLSIALALGLWYYLDRQVTKSTTANLKVDVVFDVALDDRAHRGKQDQIHVSLPSIEYSLGEIQDDDSQERLANDSISLTLTGKQHLIDQANHELEFQVQKNGITDVLQQGDEYFVKFRIEDLKHPRRPNLEELLDNMKPQTVRIVLIKNASQNLTLTKTNIDLTSLDKDTLTRIKNIRFEPATLMLRGPTELLKDITTKSPLFHITFEAANTDRNVVKQLELAQGYEWLKLQGRLPTATFELALRGIEFILKDVPVALDTSEVSAEEASKYEVKEKTATVVIRATGALLTELWTGDESKPVPAEWVRRHTRLRVFLRESDLAATGAIPRKPSLSIFKRSDMDAQTFYREGNDFQSVSDRQVINIIKKKQKEKD